MKTQTYYNTNNLTGEALKAEVAKCQTQEDAVLKIYLNTRCAFTVSDILGMCQRAGHNWIKVSIGRAVSNLKKKGELVKLARTKEDGSVHNATEHYYQINFHKYPSPQPVQKELFL